jgi:Fe-S cluster biogenesis protein NfuA
MESWHAGLPELHHSSIPSPHFPRRIQMKDQVAEALNEVRPQLQADGGDIELVDVNEETGLVSVRLVGACAGCPMSQMTLQMGVERLLKQRVPGVTKVENIGVPSGCAEE